MHLVKPAEKPVIYCKGERTTMSERDGHWWCDRCGQRLWKEEK